jgi:hypothetical protein
MTTTYLDNQPTVVSPIKDFQEYSIYGLGDGNCYYRSVYLGAFELVYKKKMQGTYFPELLLKIKKYNVETNTIEEHFKTFQGD